VADQTAAQDAVLRLVRSATKPPSVITRNEAGHILLLLPEHTPSQTEQLARNLVRLARRTRYFPAGNDSLGAPLGEWGRVRIGIAALNGRPETGDSLLQRAETALLKGDSHV